jgi:hypothetical protein
MCLWNEVISGVWFNCLTLLKHTDWYHILVTMLLLYIILIK